MTEGQFLKLYNDYSGELIDNLSQIKHESFTGDELYSFVSKISESYAKQINNVIDLDRSTNLILILQQVKHRDLHVLTAIKRIEKLYSNER